MFLDILEFQVEKKNSENCFLNMVLDLKKSGLLVQKTTFRKKSANEIKK